MFALTPDEVERYHEQGYLLVKAQEHGLVKPQDLKKWTDEVANWPKAKGKWMPYNEVTASGETQLMRTENFADYHDDFRRLLFGEGLTSILGQLAGDVSLDLRFVSMLEAGGADGEVQ
jgi:hypothetical protein